MASSVAPNIVTDGLVLALDAANSKSYEGSGTVWSDLVDNDTCNLVNGPTFDSDNGGNITFDGTNDYGTIPSYNKDNQSELSVFTWVYVRSYKTSGGNSNAILVNKRSTGAGGDMQWQLNVRNGAISAAIFGGSTTLSNLNDTGNAQTSFQLNKWFYVGFTTGGQTDSTLKVYQDGVLSDTGTLTGNRKTGSRDIILANSAYNINQLPTQCSIANVMMYNKELTPQEILQNYNSTKGRFGL